MRTADEIHYALSLTFLLFFSPRLCLPLPVASSPSSSSACQACQDAQTQPHKHAAGTPAESRTVLSGSESEIVFI